MEVREVIVEVVAGASVLVGDLHPVGEVSVLMTDIRRVLFFEDVPLFVDLVFFQDLDADLFSKCSTVFIIEFFY